MDYVELSVLMLCTVLYYAVICVCTLLCSPQVEPGLLEWLGWYPDGRPQFMTGQELVAAGHNIDLAYKPVIPVARLPKEETCEQHYDRNARATAAILANTKHQGNCCRHTGQHQIPR